MSRRPVLPAPSLAEVVGRQVELPELVRVRRVAREAPRLDVRARTRAALTRACAQLQPGDQVAVAVGSRGIADLREVVCACIDELRAHGAVPFVVPAMGSHGGATAEGQREVLRKLGITEESVGAEIRSSMETALLGTADDVEVHVDRHALAADRVLLVNRLKSHTSFSGSVESGLAKMLAIGLGKQRGAEELHRRGPAHLERRIQSAGRLLKERLRLMGGVAVVETEHKSVETVEVLGPEEIGGERETALLQQAKSHEARLPFRQLDVLVVDLMGKEISGTGMDTNVLGRRMVRGMPEPGGIEITNVVVLDVSRASEGNAVGIGLADFAPLRAMDGVDLVATYANALTAGLQGVQRAQLPIVLATDRDAVHAAVLAAGLADGDDVRIARIRSTLRLDDLMVSRNLLPECGELYAVVDDDDDDGAVAGLSFTPEGTAVPYPQDEEKETR